MLQTGAEQEWKLGQLSLEAAGKGLFSANNQVSVVSVKANSALGMPLLLMKLLLCFFLSSNVGTCKIYSLYLSLYNRLVSFAS
jgi:hypothetical protein